MIEDHERAEKVLIGEVMSRLGGAVMMCYSKGLNDEGADLKVAIAYCAALAKYHHMLAADDSGDVAKKLLDEIIKPIGEK